MTNPKWLSDFENKLHTGKLIYSNKLKPIAYYEVVDEVTSQPFVSVQKHLDANKQIKVTDNINVDILDLDKLFKRAKYSYLESVLMKRAYVGKPLVIDNSLLERLHLNYHVVYVDGIADFVINYYDTIPMANSIKSPEFKEQYFTKTTGCLVFLNDDNSYFCAIPCTQSGYLTQVFRQSKNVAYAHVDATVEQIGNLLEPVPLLKINNIYPFAMQFVSEADDLRTFQKSQTENIVPQYIYDDYITDCDSDREPFLVNYAGDRQARKYVNNYTTLVKAYSANLTKFNMFTTNYSLSNDALASFIFVREENISGYLMCHGHLIATDTGEIEIVFDIKLPNITKIINAHLNSGLHDIFTWDPNVVNSSFSSGFEMATHKLYDQMTKSSLGRSSFIALDDMQSLTTTSKELHLPSAIATKKNVSHIKPIMQDENLSHVLTLVSNEHKKIYYKNGKLLMIMFQDNSMKGKMCSLWDNK